MPCSARDAAAAVDDELQDRIVDAFVAGFDAGDVDVEVAVGGVAEQPHVRRTARPTRPRRGTSSTERGELRLRQRHVELVRRTERVDRLGVVLAVAPQRRSRRRSTATAASSTSMPSTACREGRRRIDVIRALDEEVHRARRPAAAAAPAARARARRRRRRTARPLRATASDRRSDAHASNAASTVAKPSSATTRSSQRGTSAARAAVTTASVPSLPQTSDGR